MVSHGHRETADPLYGALGSYCYSRTNFEGSSVPVKPDFYSEGIIDHEKENVGTWLSTDSQETRMGHYPAYSLHHQDVAEMRTGLPLPHPHCLR